jgi:hypothetical protein
VATIGNVREAVMLMDASERERKSSTFKNYVRIPLPLENKLARSVAIAHEQLFEGLVMAAAEIGERYGYRYAGRGKLIQDRAPDDFIRELAELVGKRGPEVEALRARINAQFVAAERAWLAQFLERGDPRARQILLTFALDKDAVFADRILALRRLYLDNAVERVLGEQNELKASFLLKLIDWAEGRVDVLDVSGIVDEIKESADKRAHFFARDQFSRFERSLTVASFEAAEAPYVEVFNSNDVRVRGVPQVPPSESHRNWPEGWGRAIFTREGLINDPRWQSYNCRCGFVPRWELTA